MKKKTLEDALFDTGAPDEIILLAMVEMYKQNVYTLNYDYRKRPFMGLIYWAVTEQGHDFWSKINCNYRIR